MSSPTTLRSNLEEAHPGIRPTLYLGVCLLLAVSLPLLALLLLLSGEVGLQLKRASEPEVFSFECMVMSDSLTKISHRRESVSPRSKPYRQAYRSCRPPSSTLL